MSAAGPEVVAAADRLLDAALDSRQAVGQTYFACREEVKRVGHDSTFI